MTARTRPTTNGVSVPKMIHRMLFRIESHRRGSENIARKLASPTKGYLADKPFQLVIAKYTAEPSGTRMSSTVSATAGKLIAMPSLRCSFRVDAITYF